MKSITSQDGIAAARQAYLRITGTTAILTKEPRKAISSYTDPQGRWLTALWSYGQVIGWKFDGTTHWLPGHEP